MTTAEWGESIPERAGEAKIPDQHSAVLLADALRKHLLLHQQMGIESYPLNRELQQFLHPQRRGPFPAPARPQPSSAGAASASRKQRLDQAVPPPPPTGERQVDLSRDLAGCTSCELSTARNAQVLGQGNIGAGLLIVGDYARSGKETDGAACLFGRAEDELLWKMMQAIGLGPGDVYVTNVVKCSPSGELVPTIENEQACRGYLHREIALVQPKIILAMGMSAARAVLGTETPVSRLRGRLHPSPFTGSSGRPIQVMVSFHPRLLLEQPAMKKGAWHDLQIVQQELRAALKAVNTPG